MEEKAGQSGNFDALLPQEMAVKAENVGVAKANLDAWSTLALAVLAGAFIGLGAVFALTVTAGSASAGMSWGVTRLLAGLVFSLGLILVIIGGAELFTGNNLIVMGWAGGRISSGRLLRNWGIVYFGNFLGSIATAVFVFLGGQYRFGGGGVGEVVLAVAEHKCSLGFLEAFFLGVLCNALVCLAVWLSWSGRTTTDKILAIIPPIAAFVAAGFEHSIANMYFIPAALLIKLGAPASFWAAIGASPADYASVTWQGFFVNNLLPVTAGNIVGGALLVGVVYWFVYLRQRKA